MAWGTGSRHRTRTADHKRFRRQVLKRDGHQCQACGLADPTGAQLYADHITPATQGGTTTLDNGQTLCERCHNLKTQGEAQAGRRLKSRYRPPETHPGLKR